MKVSQLYNFGSFVLNLGELQYLLLVLVLVLVLVLYMLPAHYNGARLVSSTCTRLMTNLRNYKNSFIKA